MKVVDPDHLVGIAVNEHHRCRDESDAIAGGEIIESVTDGSLYRLEYQAKNGFGLANHPDRRNSRVIAQSAGRDIEILGGTHVSVAVIPFGQSAQF